MRKRRLRRVLGLLLAVALLVSGLPIGAMAAEADSCPGASFTDDPWNAWYHPAVDFCVAEGLFKGTTSTTFEPETYLTRAMMVVLLHRMAGTPEATEAAVQFTDVPETYWCAGAIGWASENGIVLGYEDGTFRPEDTLTRQDMMVLFQRYHRWNGMDVSATTDLSGFPDGEAVQDHAREAVAWCVASGYIHGAILDGQILLDPFGYTTRAQFAKLLCNFYGGDESLYRHPAPEPEPVIPPDGIVTGEELLRAAEEYGISTDSRAFEAMVTINTEYTDRLSDSSASGTLLFLFEGVGSNPDPNYRKNAMAVVVKRRKIVHINRNCSTIPDRPFEPEYNRWTPMPTLKSGIYTFTTLYHSGMTGVIQCAGLNVNDARVVRHYDQSSYYSSTSEGINIHRRGFDDIGGSNHAVTSAGCLVIGNTGKGPNDEYALYTAALGITNYGDSGTAWYSYRVSGKVIVDRAFAGDYLRAVGYTDGAIELIG